MNLRVLLIVIAIVLFVLSAFGVSILGAHLGWLGLAVLAASKLAS